jgi:mono/diheme cytochrome c family protein
MKYFFLIFIFTAVAVLALAGLPGHKFRQPPFEVFPDMDRQAKVGEQQKSAFFADGMASRQPVAGTVPMGFEVPPVPASSPGAVPAAFAFTHGNDYYNTGTIGDFFGDGIPPEVAVDGALLARGAERYAIHCAICHGASGDGQGTLSKLGIANIANFHQPMFNDAANRDYRPDGSVFHTITHGKGLMGAYGANLTVRDRWAVVAHLRTLQAAAKQAAATPAAAPEGAPAGGAAAPEPAPTAN